jgi:diaminohydroxyphosphoribosylaminopyrimidine deaminase/5-amino-6-(5-phosphoribosylamino)uracil reductase
MAKAISRAKKGWFTTHPNPRVGCVVVKDNQLVAEGWHEYAGQGHAEVNALKQAGGMARGATAYVTLEPCCHFGKTPPCTQALIEAGIVRVVVGMMDPNPLVAGKGLKRLQEHAIEVKNGVLESAARALNPGFIQRMKSGRPRIRCKMAMSLDGRTAMASGESQWITSADARKDVQRLRAESSAILTGIGTVLADDPSLNVREEAYAWIKRQPDRVIMDSFLSMPATARMLAMPGNTYVFTAIGRQNAKQRKAIEIQGAQIIDVPLSNAKHLSIKHTLEKLGQLDYNDVLLEAGATLTGSMLQAGYVDELIVYVAPHLMGSDARGLFNMPELVSMSERIELDIKEIMSVGKDLRITANPLIS